MNSKTTYNMDNAMIKVKSQGKKNTLMVIVTGKDSDGKRYSFTRHLRYDTKKETYFGRKLGDSVGVYVDFGTPKEWMKKELSALQSSMAA